MNAKACLKKDNDEKQTGQRSMCLFSNSKHMSVESGVSSGLSHRYKKKGPLVPYLDLCKQEITETL